MICNQWPYHLAIPPGVFCKIRLKIHIIRININENYKNVNARLKRNSKFLNLALPSLEVPS